MLRPAAPLLLTVALATVIALPAAADEFRDATRRDTEIELLAPFAAGAAGSLDFVADCIDGNPRTRRIDFAWSPSATGALAQRLDISKFRAGFESGRFETTGALDSDRNSATLDMGEPGVRYYWRLLTQLSGGWVPSTIERFEVPICPLDSPKTLPSGQEIKP